RAPSSGRALPPARLPSGLHRCGGVRWSCMDSSEIAGEGEGAGSAAGDAAVEDEQARCGRARLGFEIDPFQVDDVVVVNINRDFAVRPSQHAGGTDELGEQLGVLVVAGAIE